MLNDNVARAAQALAPRVALQSEKKQDRKKANYYFVRVFLCGSVAMNREPLNR
jgi:hypothetical protein